MQISSKSSWPAVLSSGARVALVCGSGPLRGESDVAIAEASVRGFGWEPVRGRHVLGRRGYLAGSDAERLSDVQWALDDPAIDAVWLVRGGFGLTRIVPALSLEAFMRRPRAVIGYSDVTALHCAIAARAGVVTFHGHTGRAPLPALSAASLHAAVSGSAEPCGVWEDAAVVREGVVTGRLAGGNLALLAALCGTPDAVRGAGAILVLEDVNEAAYRVDRQLRQLEQAGAFRGCVGLAVGQFTQVPEDEHPGATSIGALVSELADRLQVPCLANLPIGHIADQWTLPLGAEATLDAAARSLVIRDAVRRITVA
ncbi:MAG: LD-carboxypeptidase [Gemmatimonadaceae bacterium]|nr:LD-carboxypeptidase [Gemmatimonadaceae bacterium]